MHYMKKILTIMAVLFCLGINANAQLNVQSKDTFNKIASVRTGLVSLKEHQGTYYITFPTTNRFDDPFIFYLGYGKESSLQTLHDLYNLFDTMDRKQTITIDNRGKSLTISKSGPTMYFSMDGYAGLAATTRMELDRFISALSE